MRQIAEKELNGFVSGHPLKLFQSLNVEDGFLKKNPRTWETDENLFTARNVLSK